jgi:hypothetical protein
MSVSPKLLQYFQNTHNLFVYKLSPATRIPSTLQFPKANTATLINCTREGVFQILTPHTFPALQTIQYISAHPGNFSVFKRFSDTVEWIFPDKQYSFYEYVIQQGKGRKDSALIERCLLNKRILDGESPFDITYEFDLHLPEYGVIGGEAYKQEFEAYCDTKLQELKNFELY